TTYDALDRLATAETNSAGTGQYTPRSFQYDALGNITAFEWVTNTYGYGQASGIASGAKPHALTHVNSAKRSDYDGNGNLVNRFSQTLTQSLSYNAENRLVAVSPVLTATFTYDGDGKRVKRQDSSGTTVYVGNYFEKIAGTDIITKYYYFGDQRIASRSGISGTTGTLYYNIGDHLGSSSLSYRATGSAVTVTQSYSPWGAIRPGPNNALTTDYTYTGQKWDASPGLMFYGSRYYDSSLGRFLQPDTIVPEPGNPQSLNRYTYVDNNPLRYTDPSGHCPTCIIGLIAGGVIGGGIYYSTHRDNLDSGQFWASVGIGAVGGTLIGTGAGIATGVAALSMIGGGTGALASQIGYIVSAGNSYNTTDMIITAGVGGVSGALSGAIGGSSGLLANNEAAAMLARPGVSAAAGAVQQGISDLRGGRNLDAGAIGAAAGIGLITGLAGEVAGGKIASDTLIKHGGAMFDTPMVVRSSGVDYNSALRAQVSLELFRAGMLSAAPRSAAIEIGGNYLQSQGQQP
ncbi:MAG: RHS repeat-associated core domain-containing protein, partial [Chloroflexi bacterium]|nr:RHS repeat-associated core domain-containing protein [Chloroflexota bacterium]